MDENQNPPIVRGGVRLPSYSETQDLQAVAFRQEWNVL